MKCLLFVVGFLASCQCFASWADMCEDRLPVSNLSSSEGSGDENDSSGQVLSDSEHEVESFQVLAKSAPSRFRKKSSSPIIPLSTRSLSLSPSRFTGLDDLTGFAQGDCYQRLVRACKQGDLSDGFRDDLRNGHDWINHAPASLRTMRTKNKTLLYYVISKCEIKDGVYSNLDNRLRMAKLLIAKKALIDLVIHPDRNDEGDSLLTIACFKSHENFVSLLLEKGADVDFVDYRGWGVMHLAAANVGRSEQVLRVLMKWSPQLDVNVLNKEGSTPLDIAMARSHQEATDYLQSIGAKTSKELGGDTEYE